MDKPALFEVITRHADGSATRGIVPAALVKTAYAQALRKAWKAKAGDLVSVYPYGVALPNTPANVERLFTL
ncbi:hypothetical protein CcrColossus_gp033 [Caulobacter phage CcrColossus]|uniref:Uncharacterized protein n=1 Tax=Caulobacter phage CcrColossus TaxID=1211640 RepID=K4JVN6_9CAUD|nr:hypothetical protein CcrColossus_gp033 [Caulobacter phage CcrColossus]AFU87903.1 hypothetical protein CcrColossus_gp033 [Caulobacter phage CcrColossus]